LELKTNQLALAYVLHELELKAGDAMLSFEHILFPVDFSPRCEAAVGAVKDMRERNQAKLTILHTAEVPFHWYNEAAIPYDISQQTCDEWVDASRKRLADFVCKHFCELASSPDARSLCELGDPGAHIVRFAEENGVDLVMMPTHGRGAFRSMLLGSITAKVLHDTHAAVWTAAHIEEQPVVHCPVRKILCAVDLGPQSKRVLHEVADLAKTLDAEVRLVHSVSTSEALPDKYFDSEYHAFMIEDARAGLAELQRETGTDMETDILSGSVPRALRDAAIEGKADLVVIGRGHLQGAMGRLRSNAYAIIRDSPCPVISF
jgi:nucleotide-binding universal stress UspA family protein